MNANMIGLAAILILSASGFVFLAIVTLANWRLTQGTKGSPFNTLNKTRLFRLPKPAADCFQGCMRRFAWNVDQTTVCTSKCKVNFSYAQERDRPGELRRKTPAGGSATNGASTVGTGYSLHEVHHCPGSMIHRSRWQNHCRHLRAEIVRLCSQCLHFLARN